MNNNTSLEWFKLELAKLKLQQESLQSKIEELKDEKDYENWMEGEDCDCCDDDDEDNDEDGEYKWDGTQKFGDDYESNLDKEAYSVHSCYVSASER